MSTHDEPDPRSSDLRDDLRGAGDSFWGDVKDTALLALPVVVGAVLGYLVTGGEGLLVGAGVGVALVAAYLLWGALSLVADAVRWWRRRSSRLGNKA